MRDMPYIDALIAGFCTSCDEPNAAEQAIVFDASLEKSGWTIVSAAKIETDAKVIAALREDEAYLKLLFEIASDSRYSSELIGIRVRNELARRTIASYEQKAGD